MNSSQQNLYGRQPAGGHRTLIDLFMSALQVKYQKSAIRQSQTISRLNDLKAIGLTDIIKEYQDKIKREHNTAQETPAVNVPDNTGAATSDATPYEDIMRSAYNLYGKEIVTPVKPVLKKRFGWGGQLLPAPSPKTLYSPYSAF